jgi:dienelactone hydrolase
MNRSRPRRPLSLVTALLLAALVPVAAAKDALPKVRRSAELAYVDAPDDAEAEERLPKLLAKYDTAKKCEGLLKALRKRSYPGRVPDRITLEHASTDGKTREFTILAPSKYSRRKPTGVLVFLHGAVSQPAPGGGANEAGLFAPAVKRLGLIVIGPSTYDRVGWDAPACRELVHHALEVVKQHYNVDENRVWLAGDSDGGRGTYAQLETAATFFGAAVPVIGAPGGVTRFLNLKNVPLFAINGETDTTFPVDHVRPLVEGMQALGIDLVYKEIAGQGHDPRFFLKYDDEICDFLEAHPREPFPQTVHWQIDPAREDFGGGFPADTCRWVRILEAGSTASNTTFEDSGTLLRRTFPRIEATFSGNRIDVKTKGVKRYAVLVSPDMLDLAQEVEVFTNGHASFRGRVEADARAILEEARRFKDRHLLFVNRIEVTVDP